MENASKALIMAGSVLIALMIIGALLLMFNSISSYQNSNQVDKRSQQIVEFNNQFETYNRTDIRGSDIISLLNKAENYNTRKSSAGVGKEGEEIAYTPISISINFDKTAVAPPGGENTLITTNEYKIKEITNDFSAIQNQINGLESTYGQAELTSLTTALTRIFISNTSTKSEQDVAVGKVNEIMKKRGTTYTWSTIKEGSNLRKAVYQYYEYIQFKRLHFDCEGDEAGTTSGVEYDKNTGRIIKMTFYDNGKIE